jgi:hypothetical protein
MSRLTVRTSRISLPVLLFMLLFSVAMFGDSADQIAKQLAGKDAREWVFKRFETFMGSKNQCKQGESYRFKADHTVIISRCINGQVNDETQQWSIESDQLETRLKLGDVRYILKFWDTPRGHFMMLRTKATTKTEKTVDKTFQLAEE